MSLAITVIIPEGVVQAADSRVSIPVSLTDSVLTYSHLDNATKLLVFEKPHDNISVTTYGAGTIGARTAYSFVQEFQKTLPPQRVSVKKFAQLLQTFYKAEWDKIDNNPQTSPMVFQVAGINASQQFGELYVVSIPGDDPPQKVIGNGQFSLYYGGDKSIVERLVQGRDTRIDGLIINEPALNDRHAELERIFSEVEAMHGLPLGAYALQDAIDLARFLIATTAQMQKLSLNLKSVGGAIDVSCVTKAGACELISKKKVV